jgi:hypothetical protein
LQVRFEKCTKWLLERNNSSFLTKTRIFFAARLMESPMNKGILVGEAVRSQADARFEFCSLQPVKAKFLVPFENCVYRMDPFRLTRTMLSQTNNLD